MRRDRKKVIILGAGGNAGSRLLIRALERGDEVTVFVRDSRRLHARLGRDLAGMIRVIEGDLLDERTVAQSLEGHEAAVCAAGHNSDPRIFEAICRIVITQAETQLIGSRRLWLFGGLPGLTVPHTRVIGADLPGMPAIFRSHKINYEQLKASTLDWSFICPGPMYFSNQEGSLADVKISTEFMPYEIGPWTGRLPKIVHPFIMRSRLERMVTSYENVAYLIMENLGPRGPYSRKRVGIADANRSSQNDR